MRDRAEQRGCLAVVLLDGGGFWTSAIRSFLTGMRMLAPNKLDIGLHESLPEAAQWFVQQHAKATGVRVAAESFERNVLATLDRCTYQAATGTDG